MSSLRLNLNPELGCPNSRYKIQVDTFNYKLPLALGQTNTPLGLDLEPELGRLSILTQSSQL